MTEDVQNDILPEINFDQMSRNSECTGVNKCNGVIDLEWSRDPSRGLEKFPL